MQLSLESTPTLKNDKDHNSIDGNLGCSMCLYLKQLLRLLSTLTLVMLTLMLIMVTIILVPIVPIFCNIFFLPELDLSCHLSSFPVNKDTGKVRENLIVVVVVVVVVVDEDGDVDNYNNVAVSG